MTSYTFLKRKKKCFGVSGSSSMTGGKGICTLSDLLVFWFSVLQ